MERRKLSLTLRTLEDQDRFSEAEAVLQDLQRMREQRQREALLQERLQQASEAAAVDSAHLYYYDQQHAAWEKDLQAFDAETQRMAGELQAKQEEERKDLEAELSAPSRVKLTPRLLNLRERKQQAIRQRRYRDAQSLTVEIEELFEKFGVTQRAKLDTKAQLRMNSLLQMHAKEVKAFQMKRSHQKAELQQRKEEALCHLRKQYEKNKRELFDLHKLQTSQRPGTQLTSIARVLTVSRSCLGTPRNYL